MIVGVDFGAPKLERHQRRKILAVAAQSTGWRTYRVAASGMNARLLANAPPGWSARELVDELLARPARVVGFDFPFGIPHLLLRDSKFAANVGFKADAFGTWRSFNWWVAQRLQLTDPLDFTPFAAWRDPTQRARLWTKRATDVAAHGQPPLKDKFQATFQMMLLGNALLAKLWESHKYRVLPFPGGRGDNEVIEVYPRATLRAMGLASYKARPDEALRLGLAACKAEGIQLDIDPRILALACHYNSGRRKNPDFDLADAVVALCTSILYVEGKCRPALAPDPEWHESYLKEREGAIWVPKLASARDP